MMALTQTKPWLISTTEDDLPPLENGERLDQPTFHARYEAMSEGTRAELIGGIVYLASSPVSACHSNPHALVVGWLCDYAGETAGVDVHDNPSIILAEGSEPQPDACLRLLPENGGRTWEENDYVHGAPELAVEVAASSTTSDLHQKKADYESAGVDEYVVVVVRSRQVRWFVMENGQYQELAPDSNGVFQSRRFPGLWLDPAAIFQNDIRRLKATLRQGMKTPEHRAWAARMRKPAAASEFRRCSTADTL